MPTLPQNGVNPTSLPLWVFQHFLSFVTKIGNPMLANKFYKGGIFVNCVHFYCNIIYYSHSLIHQWTIPVTHRVIHIIDQMWPKEIFPCSHDILLGQAFNVCWPLFHYMILYHPILRNTLKICFDCIKSRFWLIVTKRRHSCWIRKIMSGSVF